jgi:hypothetical protein
MNNKRKMKKKKNKKKKTGAIHYPISLHPLKNSWILLLSGRVIPTGSLALKHMDFNQP